jgi:hypothetical protein
MQPKCGCLTGEKTFCGKEQTGVVATLSQLGNITGQALPQSNLIGVTLFGLTAQRS